MLIKTYIHTKLVGFSFRHAMIFWKNNYIMWCLQHDISSVNFLMHPSQILLLHYLSSISQNRYQQDITLFSLWWPHAYINIQNITNFLISFWALIINYHIIMTKLCIHRILLVPNKFIHKQHHIISSIHEKFLQEHYYVMQILCHGASSFNNCKRLFKYAWEMVSVWVFDSDEEPLIKVHYKFWQSLFSL